LISLRDKQGRFLHGHKPLPKRNAKTGRFVSNNSMENKTEYTMVEQKIDRLLDLKFKTGKQLLEENKES